MIALKPFAVSPARGFVFSHRQRASGFTNVWRQATPVSRIWVGGPPLKKRVEAAYQTGQEMKALLWAEKEEAKKRQGKRNDLNIVQNLAGSSSGSARDKVGALFGVSGRTVETLRTGLTETLLGRLHIFICHSPSLG